MPKFRYIAFDKAGKKQTGAIDADTQADASRALSAKGLTVLEVKEAGAGSIEIKLNLGGVSNKDITLFTRQLAVVIKSGLDLAEALLVVRDVSPNPKFREILQKVYADISTGVPFSDALGKHKAFSNFLVEMVRAGEASGNLDMVLNKVAGQLEKGMRMKASIKKALTYPTVIMLIALLGTGFLLVAVVPQFVGIIESLETDMPKLTEIVIGASDFVQANFLYIGGALTALVFLAQRWRATPKGRQVFDNLILRAPIFGPIVHKSSLTNFTSSLSFCLASGLNLLDALDVTLRVVGIAPIENALEEVKVRVREGYDFSSSLAQHENLFPKLMTGMMRVGEASGEMEDTLNSVAAYYELEVEEATGSLSSMIEPLIMVFLGGVVGTIVAAMMLPMMQAMQAIR